MFKCVGNNVVYKRRATYVNFIWTFKLSISFDSGKTHHVLLQVERNSKLCNIGWREDVKCVSDKTVFSVLYLWEQFQQTHESRGSMTSL